MIPEAGKLRTKLNNYGAAIYSFTLEPLFLMLIWNWIVTGWGLPSINFWEALGISILASIIFQSPMHSLAFKHLVDNTDEMIEKLYHQRR